MSGITSGISGLMGTGATLGPSPGAVDPFSLGALGQNTGTAIQAMQNRYDQLGLSGNKQVGGTDTTAEAMDIGLLPSVGGGIMGMSGGTLGQMETAALNQPSGLINSGKGSGSGSKF